MGVKGLWELLHPVARPIKLDSLSNKHLAIDASIWLNQFLKGMRDKEGNVVGNAHIIGFFRRICKLLHYNIKPVFVFDGGTPALKRLTIQERRKRKRHDVNMVKRTAEKLLAAQLRLHALNQKKANRKAVQEKRAQKNNQLEPGSDNSASDSNVIGDTDGRSLQHSKVVVKESDQTGSQAKRINDVYVLPPMDTDFETLSKIRDQDERFGYSHYQSEEADSVQKFLDELKTEDGLTNIDSDVFKALPSEVQYEILHDIRARSRVTSYERVQEMVRMSETPLDFSKLQVQGVIRRNTVTQKLLTVNQAVSKIEATVQPGRIASQRNRQYILIKNEEGGWALGGKKHIPGVSVDKPVELDSDEDTVKVEGRDEQVKSESEEDDDDYEEVKIVGQVAMSTTDKAHVEIPSAPARTETSAEKAEDGLLINQLEAYMDDDESIENVMTKFAELEEEARESKIITRPLVPRAGNDTTGRPLAPRPIAPQSDQLHDDAQQQLTTTQNPGCEPLWPESVPDADELESFYTHNSDTTIDYADFDDMVEDEQTGDIISRAEYNQRQTQLAIQESQRIQPRSLSEAEESQLDLPQFHSYWVGHIPDNVKSSKPEVESDIREAVYEWDQEALIQKIRSASIKLEKSSINDTLKIEDLQFWKTFLESTLLWRQSQGQEKTTTDSESGKNRKSGLRKSILIEDDEDDEDDEDVAIIDDMPEASPIKSTVPTKRTLEEVAPEQIVLDFSTSLLKRKIQGPSPAITTTSEAVELNRTLQEGPSENKVFKETVIENFNHDQTIVDTKIESVIVEHEQSVDVEDMAPPSLEMLTPQPEDSAEEPEGPKEMEEGDDNEGEDEDEDEDEEDEMNEMALQDEEQNFTNHFPGLAALPGVILKGKEPSPPLLSIPLSLDLDIPLQPVLSPEEQALVDQQGAQKMFEESRQLESEIKVLQDQRRKHLRNADDVTETMVAETQSLLRLFGIPYLVAPMEAEAQCADLQIRGVVDGILTEDSDVFLFGGVRVFKNMFREEQHVECYLMRDVERELGVGRDRLVSLAYLLGSDYTVGVKGVGIVTAMEILRLFPTLESFASWWRGEVRKNETEADQDGNGDDQEKENKKVETLEGLSRQADEEIALEKLSKLCKKIYLPSTFPDPHVADAYQRPLVDDDETRFQWGIPDLDGLRGFLRKSLGWDQGEVDRVLLPIIRQMVSTNQQQAQQSHQMRLDSFFDSSGGMGAYQPRAEKKQHKSARLRKVVSGLTAQRSLVQSKDNGDHEKEGGGDKDDDSDSSDTNAKAKGKSQSKVTSMSKSKGMGTENGDGSGSDSGSCTSSSDGGDNEDEDPPLVRNRKDPKTTSNTNDPVKPVSNAQTLKRAISRGSKRPKSGFKKPRVSRKKDLVH
ncbi:DNA repair protein rad2 [Lunasporangiospora selenospora]|uniref:DNA repair protein rad2 n=1 Tax=Lunasporangiospora selenospora TaxID=979761 RepID=A0A9P6FSS1_9FUNG|nr:DNA repair protein rad2 [Lunasporangiospora selenospora]